MIVSDLKFSVKSANIYYKIVLKFKVQLIVMTTQMNLHLVGKSIVLLTSINVTIQIVYSKLIFATEKMIAEIILMKAIYMHVFHHHSGVESANGCAQV